MGSAYLVGQKNARRLATTCAEEKDPVANRARTHGAHPRQAALDARIRDWELMQASKDHEQGVKKRLDTGGYHKPGSYK